MNKTRSKEIELANKALFRMNRGSKAAAFRFDQKTAKLVKDHKARLRAAGLRVANLEFSGGAVRITYAFDKVVRL